MKKTLSKTIFDVLQRATGENDADSIEHEIVRMSDEEKYDILDVLMSVTLGGEGEFQESRQHTERNENPLMKTRVVATRSQPEAMMTREHRMGDREISGLEKFLLPMGLAMSAAFSEIGRLAGVMQWVVRGQMQAAEPMLPYLHAAIDKTMEEFRGLEASLRRDSSVIPHFDIGTKYLLQNNIISMSNILNDVRIFIHSIMETENTSIISFRDFIYIVMRMADGMDFYYPELVHFVQQKGANINGEIILSIENMHREKNIMYQIISELDELLRVQKGVALGPDDTNYPE